MSRALLRLIGSSLLLVGGFVLYLTLVYTWKRPADPEAALKLRQSLEVYGRLLAVRGLLPQLWIALPLAALLRRLFPGRASTRAGFAGLLAVAAGLAGALVVGLLLPANLPGAPRVVYTGPLNVALTWLEMTAAVLAAALLPRLLWPVLR
jgi:hypothetical protein